MFEFDELGFQMNPIGAFEERSPGRMRLHGGGSAPAPDPRLVEAQVKSLGIQDEMLQRIVTQSEALQPLQKEQMQFGLDSAKLAFDQSQADREYALDRRGALTGLQDQLVSDAEKFNDPARRAELRGEAYADVNAAFTNAQGQAARQASRMGVNPNSGRSLAMANNTSLAQAGALAGGSQRANATARAEGYALTDRATNALAGYPAMGQQTTGAGAAYAASGLSLANQGQQGMTAGYGAAGSMAGQMGNNATGMYGQQSSAHQQSKASDQAATGTMVGLGVTAAIAI